MDSARSTKDEKRKKSEQCQTNKRRCSSDSLNRNVSHNGMWTSLDDGGRDDKAQQSHIDMSKYFELHISMLVNPLLSLIFEDYEDILFGLELSSSDIE